VCYVTYVSLVVAIWVGAMNQMGLVGKPS